MTSLPFRSAKQELDKPHAAYRRGDAKARPSPSAQSGPVHNTTMDALRKNKKPESGKADIEEAEVEILDEEKK